MTWTAPRTFVAGELETAAIFNTHLRDNLNALHDFLTGAQDLAANWLISSGRTLSLGDATNVAHGMTTIAPTSTYMLAQKASSTDGGIKIQGLSDTAAGYGMILQGIVGNATPTNPAFGFVGSKKNGTGTQDLAASESVFQFVNNSTELGRWYGGGFNVVGGLSVGFTGVPAAAALYVGDATFKISNTGTPTIQMDTGDFFYYDRAANFFYFAFGGGGPHISFSSVGIILDSNNGLSVGTGNNPAAGTIMFSERVDPGVGPADSAQLYCKDNGAGKTQLVVVFSSGAVQVIATQP